MKQIILAIGLLTILLPLPAGAAEIREIVFPIQGAYTTFSDSFGDPRSGGRVHEGIDIMAPKMTPLVSAVDGYVSSLPQEEPDWGYTIYIQDSDGYAYRYYHVNNDTPGTDRPWWPCLCLRADNQARGAGIGRTTDRLGRRQRQCRKRRQPSPL